MKVRVEFYINDERDEIEYYSNFNRINAKGIKEELKNEIIKKIGSNGFYAEVYNFYRIDLAEKKRIREKKYYEKNKEKHKKYCKEYYLKNKEKHREYYKEYRKTHKEEHAAAQKKYRKKLKMINNKRRDK